MSDNQAPLVRADAWAGVAFTIFGAVIAFEAWRMPRLEERLIDPFTEPGIVPAMLGISLFLLGVILTVRAARGGGFAGPPVTAEWLRRDSTRRLLLTFGLFVIYALVLVGRIHFMLASFLFLITFMMVFGLKPRQPGAFKRAALYLVVAAVVAFGVSYLFQDLFLVRLP